MERQHFAPSPRAEPEHVREYAALGIKRGTMLT
jgi:hypothetical protein